MNITAIVSEYNPLHKGHVYHINKTKEITNCDGIIAIMSGNFVQRGIPAVIDKWNRTRMALENGIDLVIELPCLYSLSSAEFFSFGAVSLMNSLGVVDNISFGSESGDMNNLLNIAKTLSNEPEEYKIILKTFMNEGYPYPVSRSKALIKYFTEKNYEVDIVEIEEILNNSNNILGIEYCKSILSLSSNIKPFTLKRRGGEYNSEALNETFSSATSIRKALKGNTELHLIKEHMPETVFQIILELERKGCNLTFEDAIVPYLKYKCFSTQNRIEHLPDVSEGIHNRIYESLQNSSTYDELIHSIKSKRYTYTRISRILCQYFIGFENFDTKNMRKMACPYVRVLGFNETGKKILKEIKSNCEIPILTKLPNKIDDEVLGLDIQSTRVYSLINRSIKPYSDFTTSPIMK